MGIDNERGQDEKKQRCTHRVSSLDCRGREYSGCEDLSGRKVMPKPMKRVSDGRPRQAVFAASVKQFPKRLVLVTEGDSWFSYPLNSNIADYIEMMSDFSILRLEHNGDEAREMFGAGSEQLK